MNETQTCSVCQRGDFCFVSESLRLVAAAKNAAPLIVSSNPVSQKNQHEIHRNRKTGARWVATSNRVMAYRDAAVLELKKQWRFGPPIKYPVIVWYKIYRKDQRRQDMANALEAVFDAMQQAGIVENDSLIVPRAICPIEIDKLHPRIELRLELWQPAAARDEELSPEVIEEFYSHRKTPYASKKTAQILRKIGAREEEKV